MKVECPFNKVMISQGCYYYFKYGVSHAENFFDMLVDGVLHREDGPAVEYESFPEKCDYYLDNVKYKRDDYYKELYNRGIIDRETMILEVL